MNSLLAKSKRAGRDISLLQHTRDVMDAAEYLFGVREKETRLAKEWLRFFRIPIDHYPAFQINLLAAAGCHDWGKANDSFQGAVMDGAPQIIRHEHLSALLVGLDEVSAWLKQQPDIDVDLVLSVVMTHHLKAAGDINKSHPFAARLTELRTLRLYDDHPEFAQLIDEVRVRLSLPVLELPLSKERFWGFRSEAGGLPPCTFDLETQRERLKDQRLRTFQLALRRDESRRRMLWGVRAGLIAADAVGSALPRVGEDLHGWIEAAFAEADLCDEQIVWNIIRKRVDRIQERLRQAGNGLFKWDAFQLACSDPQLVSPRALLLAPCGAGKTLAAWRWVAARMKERPAARVLFLYPTRATAKEGFRDYVSWAPETDAALMHGTAAYDLKDLFANPDDPRRENSYEVNARLYALGFWTRRIFSATVDQFLAFLQYAYGPVCMLPVLADAAVVIDEVHSFDNSMFTALKKFLTNFDVPVLCMTATLPERRRNELERECRLSVYDDKPGELRQTAAAPRYRLQRITEAETLQRARAALAAQKRVLWVVNQVRRAQRAAVSMAFDFQPDPSQGVLRVRLSDKALAPLFCYHSRFKLNDRVMRHNQVIEAFQEGFSAAVAITTQVCEMSLDLNADVLITEECPITSMIQRMGRCNRSKWPRPLTQSGDVLVYKPENAKPYDATTLTGIDQFLASLDGRASINQDELEAALRAAPAPPALADGGCNFLESGPYALSGDIDFRDAEEFTRPALLRSDVERFLGSDWAEQPGFVIGVPHRLAREQDTRLPSYLGVAPNENYHAALGFCDGPLDEMRGTS
jgi:CRISPR-associated endonuclease/helicase Cas3